jgi:hypothetical protein
VKTGCNYSVAERSHRLNNDLCGEGGSQGAQRESRCKGPVLGGGCLQSSWSQVSEGEE